MPPLAHYLAPQIMARAREIEAELGPPPGAGYLAQTNVGFEKTPYDPRGLVDKPAEKSFDSRTPGGHVLEGIGIMQRSGDPIAQKVARAFLAGATGKVAGNEGSYRAPQAGRAADPYNKTAPLPMMMPMPGAREPIGMTESGEAIYAPAPPTEAAPRAGKLKLKRGEAVGIDEKGESVTSKGKKLGYLASADMPMGMVAGAGRELPLRDLARRPSDAPMDRRDAFGASALQRLYTPHLKAMQERFQDTGREEFPPGYFNGMTPTKRKEIEDGVKALRDMERGQPA